MNMTNEQTQALKAAAEKASRSLMSAGGMEMALENYDFITLATPNAILSLLAERDADKALIAELRNDVDAANARVDAGCAQLCSQDEEIATLRQCVTELEESKTNLAILYDANLCDMLTGVEYMDPPDGGQVEPIEQVSRMVADYRQQIAEQAKRITELDGALNLASASYAGERERADALQARTLTVKLPKPHAHLICIQAGHGPDDYWDDVEVSRSEKDRCCDGSERYPVYSTFEIQEACAAAGITLVVEE